MNKFHHFHMNTGLRHTQKWIRPILSPDFYCVSIVASGTDGGMELENRVYGYIQFNNEFEGHLPANEYPKLYVSYN